MGWTRAFLQSFKPLYSLLSSHAHKHAAQRFSYESVAMEEFLKQCQQSGDAAYSALRSLLERLEDPSTRADARIFLSEVHKRFESKEASETCLQTYHFQIQDIYLEQYEGTPLPLEFFMLLVDGLCWWMCFDDIWVFDKEWAL